MGSNFRLVVCAGLGMLVSTVMGCGGDEGTTGSPGVQAAPGATPAAPTAGAGLPAATGGVGAQPGTGGVGAQPGTGGVGGPPLPAPSGNNWSQMGYDANNWYFNPQETTLTTANAGQLVEKWRVGLGGYPPGTPLIVDGLVIVMTTTGTYALRLADGTTAWENKSIGGTASVAHEGAFLYVHGYTSGQPVLTPVLYKLNVGDGTVVWGPEVTYDGPEAATRPCDATSSPIVAGGVVAVGHSCGSIEVGIGAGGGLAKGGVEAHSAETGEKLWSYTSVEGSEDGAMVWSSVSIDPTKNMLYAATGNNYTVLGANSDAIHAIDLMTGSRMWKQQGNTDDLWSLFVNGSGPDTDFGSNPIITGEGTIAAGDKGSTFWVFDEATGAVRWSRTNLSSSRDAAHGGMLMNGAYDGQAFYALVNDSGRGTANLVAFNKADGTDKWPAKTLSGTAWGAPSLANGLLFVPISSRLLVMDAANGQELKSFETGGTIAAGAPAVAQGHVCVQSGLEYPLSTTTAVNDEVICYGLP